jgi:hypothetical protein
MVLGLHRAFTLRPRLPGFTARANGGKRIAPSAARRAASGFVVAARRPKIARSFNCGWSGPKPIKPQRGGRRRAKDPVVPPGLDFIWCAKPAVETAGYCHPRRRRWGWPILPSVVSSIIFHL